MRWRVMTGAALRRVSNVYWYSRSKDSLQTKSLLEDMVARKVDAARPMTAWMTAADNGRVVLLQGSTWIIVP